MGFYVNDSFWEDIKDLTEKQQDALMGAWARLAFEDKEPSFTGMQKAVYKFGAERVLLSKKRCESGTKGGKQTRSKVQAKCESNSKQNGSKTEANLKQTPKQNLENGEANLLNKENENENDIKEVTTNVVTKKNAKRFSAPTQHEVDEYCRERGNSVDAGRFVDFYASKGWTVGKSPMKDWKAAVRTWERSGNGDVEQFTALDFKA